MPDYTVYSIAKAGMVMMTKALAQELGPAIRVNAIAPGATDTELSVSLMDDVQRERRKQTPLARAIKRPEGPDDLIGACVYLSSEASDFMTGNTLVVDGGAVMW